MDKTHDDIVCVEAVAVLNAVEVAVVECSQIFREVAGGEPLDPQRAFRATAFACRFPTGDHGFAGGANWLPAVPR